MKAFVTRIHEAVERQRAAEDAERAEETLPARWAAGDPEAIKRVDELVAAADSSIDYLQAQTVAGVLDKVEGFNRLMASAQWRRDGLLREIERRRHLRFAQRAREELHKLDADVTVEAAAQPAKKDAA
jgi:hypothetical protein